MRGHAIRLAAPAWVVPNVVLKISTQPLTDNPLQPDNFGNTEHKGIDGVAAWDGECNVNVYTRPEHGWTST